MPPPPRQEDLDAIDDTRNCAHKLQGMRGPRPIRAAHAGARSREAEAQRILHPKSKAARESARAK